LELLQPLVQITLEHSQNKAKKPISITQFKDITQQLKMLQMLQEHYQKISKQLISSIHTLQNTFYTTKMTTTPIIKEISL
jgi:hypothetical protein